MAEQVKERPILFSGAMVRANLREINPKTQTRRVINAGKLWKHTGVTELSSGDMTSVDEYGFLIADYIGQEQLATCRVLRDEGQLVRCPYGKPGDRLWVRETWQQVHPCQVDEGRFSIEGRAGIPGPPKVAYRVIYAADGSYPRIHFQEGEPTFPFRERCLPDCTHQHLHPEECFNGWMPSIHMPRWASRLALEITKVRVERVQEITPDDCIAEGVEYPVAPSGTPGKVNPLINISDRNLTPHLMKIKGKYTHENLLIAHYAGLWDSINAKREGGIYAWEKNPWVWVVEYKRLEGTKTAPSDH